MTWISNGDPPLYVWPGDDWYNQDDKKLYHAYTLDRAWYCPINETTIPFPKKTKVLQEKI